MMWLLSLLLELLFWLLVLRVIIDFLPSLRQTPFGKLIQQATEPALSRLRRFVPPLSMGDSLVDLSPVIAVIVIHLIQTLIGR